MARTHSPGSSDFLLYFFIFIFYVCPELMDEGRYALLPHNPEHMREIDKSRQQTKVTVTTSQPLKPRQMPESPMESDLPEPKVTT